jgi:glycosyltransferase involved in cell wall biosynthesis
MSVILTIIPYAFYPPQNGGSLRCFYLIREMAREHHIYLFTVQPATDFPGDGEPAFPKNVTIISLYNAPIYKSLFNWLPGRLGDAINFRVLQKTFRTSTNSYFLQAYPSLLKGLKKLKPDLVFYENLEAVGFFSSIVRKQLPTAMQVYDAHNIDSELWKQLAAAEDNTVFKTYAANALLAETHLYKRVDAFCCCSEADREKLFALNKGRLPGFTISNGVDTNAKPFDKNPLKHSQQEILFCGSLDYYPNEEGLIWFYEHVFPLIKKAIPEAVLTLVGASAKNERNQKLWDDHSVHAYGSVADLQPFYYAGGVCIAPLLSGSGTRLKILEAMSFGNPVVSTSVGAKGIEAEDGIHILIATDSKDFANQVLALMKNKALFDKTRQNARQLVSSVYDWKVIGCSMDEQIKSV